MKTKREGNEWKKDLENIVREKGEVKTIEGTRLKVTRGARKRIIKCVQFGRGVKQIIADKEGRRFNEGNKTRRVSNRVMGRKILFPLSLCTQEARGKRGGNKITDGYGGGGGGAEHKR